MKRIIPIIALAVIVAAMLFVFGTTAPPEPRDYVQTETFANFSNIFFDYEIFRYPSNVQIRDINDPSGNVTWGVVTDPWNINFGVIPGNGTVVQRNMVLTNKKDSDSLISLKAYGNISDKITFSKNDFVLKTGENQSIDIFFSSNMTEYGNYTGEIDIVVKKAIYNFLPID